VNEVTLGFANLSALLFTLDRNKTVTKLVLILCKCKKMGSAF
jgi:hypothetical protein